MREQLKDTLQKLEEVYGRELLAGIESLGFVLKADDFGDIPPGAYVLLSTIRYQLEATSEKLCKLIDQAKDQAAA